MIEQNSNVINDPNIKRIVEHTTDSKQINILDSRFYRRSNKYYPSVTSILNYFPKNNFFHAWLKDVGHNSEIIMKKAAYEGTQVHDAIESFLGGNEITWIDQYGTAKYQLDVWKMILRFADFWNQVKPELISNNHNSPFILTIKSAVPAYSYSSENKWYSLDTNSGFTWFQKSANRNIIFQTSN